MAFLNSIRKIVPTSLFTKPNSLILASCHRPVFLEQSQVQTIEHVHSLKALIRTIQTLESLRSHQNWHQDIQNELSNLQQNLENYSRYVRSFVKKGGLLTGEGIGNIYFSAEKLFYTSEWLEENVHHEAILKYKYMNRQNLIDTIAGLKKYHPNSPYLNQLEQQLASRTETNPLQVEHAPNTTVNFHETQNSKSNHPLINAILTGKSSSWFQVYNWTSLILWRFRRPLHSE